MSVQVITAIGSAIAVVVSAIFAGLMQLQHNRQMHAPDQGSAVTPPAPPAGPAR